MSIDPRPLRALAFAATLAAFAGPACTGARSQAVPDGGAGKGGSASGGKGGGGAAGSVGSAGHDGGAGIGGSVGGSTVDGGIDGAMTCGTQGRACCTGNTCTDGSICAAGTCVHCGNCDVGCQVLAKNTLDGMTFASIAVSQGSLFIRTDAFLYRIGK